MACPECDAFYVAGNRNPEVRCWAKTWERGELVEILRYQAERQAQLAEDIKNPDYLINGGKHLPPIRWGYQEFECKGGNIKDRIGCPGIEEDLTGQLEASLLERIQA